MKNYIELAIKTEPKNYDTKLKNLDENKTRILHAFLGLSTEAAELLDNLKRNIFYNDENKPLDTVNIKEEMGDIFFYLAMLCDAIGCTFEEVQAANIAKLRARYGDKFSNEKANNRNLKLEREVLSK